MNRSLNADRVASFLPACALLVALSGCIHQRVPTPAILTPRPGDAQQATRSEPVAAHPVIGDSITLVSVSQVEGTDLEAGVPANFLVRLEYSLTTYDSALLSVGLEQFENPESCSSGPGEILPSRDSMQTLPISRGTHSVALTLTWEGGNPKPDQTHPRTGAVSLQTAMSLIQPPYRFLTRSFGTQFCQHF
jgi:hypothetical protein